VAVLLLVQSWFSSERRDCCYPERVLWHGLL